MLLYSRDVCMFVCLVSLSVTSCEMVTSLRAHLGFKTYRVAAACVELYCLAIHSVAWPTGVSASPSELLKYDDTNNTVSGSADTKLSLMPS